MGVGTYAFLAPELCSNYVELQDGLARLRESAAHESVPMPADEGNALWEEHEHRSYSNKVDNYAFGIMLWEMLTHERPWAGLEAAELFRLVSRGERPAIPANQHTECPGVWRELMQGCWDQDPASRLGFSEIHSILRSLHMQVVNPTTSPHG